MNQSIHLNFLTSQKRPPKIGWLVLAAGIALAGWQVLEFSGLLKANSEMQAELKSTITRQNNRKQEVRNQPATTALERSAIAQARGVATQLNYPWQSLLMLVETAQYPDVALLALDPKVSNGQIRITAEAKNASVMLAYVGGFQRNQLLQRALLTSHQVQLQVPGEPLRFQILAQWKSVLPDVPLDSLAQATHEMVASEKITP